MYRDLAQAGGMERPNEWRFDTFDTGPLDHNHLGVNFSFFQAKPGNAMDTARWLRERGWRGSGLDPTFVDVMRDLVSAKQMARGIARTARKARRQGGRVAFVSEDGGYPFPETPSVFRGARRYYRNTLR